VGALVVATASVMIAAPGSAEDETVIRTLAGSKVEADPGRLAAPRTMAVDNAGNIFFTDTDNHLIRRLDPSGVVTNVAGTGSEGEGPDGVPATDSAIWRPHGVAVDNRGHVFIADSPNHRIRRVDLATGIVTTVAGTGTAGFSGDGGPATEAKLDRPRFLIVDPDGSLIIADTANRRVRRVDPSGIITTIAGNGRTAYSGDGGPATEAALDDPRGLARDAAGNLYVSNAEGSPVPTVRRIGASGVITTVAGGNPAGFGGDGGPATEARLNEPRSIAIHGQNLYIADSRNFRIRRVDLGTGIITTVAGTGSGGFSGDGGPPTSARLAEPRGVAVMGNGTVLIADTGNNRIRAFGPGTGGPVTPPPPAAEFNGHVTDMRGAPAGLSRVDVAGADGDVITSLPTADNGRFAFGLEDGRYRLAARAAHGCAPLRSPETVVDVIGGNAAPATAELQLRPAPGAPDTDPLTANVDVPGPGEVARVTIDSPAGEVTLDFDGVTRDGKVTVACRAALPTPDSHRWLDTGVLLSSSVRFDGVTICLPYSHAQIAARTGLDAPEAEPRVAMARADVGDALGGASRNAARNEVCARVTELGEFALGIAGLPVDDGGDGFPAGVVPRPTGYRMVAADGGIFSFGEATFFGSTGAMRLNKPIVGMAATPTGQGYWLVASDGGIFSFGDAAFHGSTGALTLSRPITGIAPTPTGAGYWMVASDGGIFSFGDAAFHGSTAATIGGRTITGMVPTPTGRGYWLGSTDGRVFPFGDAGAIGSIDTRLNQPIVALAPAAS
jgi:sugar lactone lactonase YvrE